MPAERSAKRDYIVVLDQSGLVVAHSRRPELILERTLAQIVEDYPDLAELARSVTAGGEGLLATSAQDLGAAWVAWCPLINGWTIAVVFEEEEILAEANRLRSTIALLGLGGALLLHLLPRVGAHAVPPVEGLPAEAPSHRHFAG